MNNGGPAFPGTVSEDGEHAWPDSPDHHNAYLSPGMTLLDWFAGHALAALISSDRSGNLYAETDVNDGKTMRRNAAMVAYAYAAEMVKVRGEVDA